MMKYWRANARLDPAMRIAAVVPAAVLLLAFVALYATSFPVWETWYFIPVWADFHNGGPWLADLFISRWGHITAVPNFVNLVLDRLFNYDQRAPIVLNVIVMVLTLYLLIARFLPKQARLTTIFLGLTFLSLRAAEIWLDGWNTVMTISLLLAIAAGACILRSISWKALGACAVLTFIGINSGGYCLPVLPAVAVVIGVQWFVRQRNGRQAAAQLAAWLMCCVAFGLYWRHLRRGHPGAVLHTALSPPFYADFARELAFAFGDQRLGFAVLAASIAVFALALPFGLRRLRNMENLQGLLFLAVYASVLGFMIGTSRSAHGELPLHSRYIPFLCLLPAALLAFAETVLNEPGGGWADVAISMRKGLRWVLVILIATAIYNDIARWQLQRANAPPLSALDRAWRESPWTLTSGMFLHRAHLDPVVIVDGLATMRRLKMGPFARPDDPRMHDLRDAPRNSALHNDAVHYGLDQTLTESDGSVTLIGWAFDQNTSAPPADIFAAAEGACSETALRGLQRPDVAEVMKTYAAEDSGWSITLPAPCVRKAKGKPVIVYFISRDRRWSELQQVL